GLALDAGTRVAQRARRIGEAVDVFLTGVVGLAQVVLAGEIAEADAVRIRADGIREVVSRVRAGALASEAGADGNRGVRLAAEGAVDAAERAEARGHVALVRAVGVRGAVGGAEVAAEARAAEAAAGAVRVRGAAVAARGTARDEGRLADRGAVRAL